MRYNHLLAVPLAAGLVAAASGLAMAATSGAVTVDPAKLGFAATVAAPSATPRYVQLAYDDSPGSVDKQGRVERIEHQREDPLDRPDPGDRQDNRPNRPERPHR